MNKKFLVIIGFACVMLLAACSGSVETTVCELGLDYDTATIRSEDGRVLSVELTVEEDVSEWIEDGDEDRFLEEELEDLERLYATLSENGITIEVDLNNGILTTTVTMDYTEIDQMLLEMLGAVGGADYVTLEAAIADIEDFFNGVCN